MNKLFAIGTDYGGPWSEGSDPAWHTAVATCWAAGLAAALATHVLGGLPPERVGRRVRIAAPLLAAVGVAGPFAVVCELARPGIFGLMPCWVGCAAGTAVLGVLVAVRRVR